MSAHFDRDIQRQAYSGRNAAIDVQGLRRFRQGGVDEIRQLDSVVYQPVEVVVQTFCYGGNISKSEFFHDGVGDLLSKNVQKILVVKSMHYFAFVDAVPRHLTAEHFDVTRCVHRLLFNGALDKELRDTRRFESITFTYCFRFRQSTGFHHTCAQSQVSCRSEQISNKSLDTRSTDAHLQQIDIVSECVYFEFCRRATRDSFDFAEQNRRGVFEAHDISWKRRFHGKVS